MFVASGAMILDGPDNQWNMGGTIGFEAPEFGAGSLALP
jgi:hypothetical protein